MHLRQIALAAVLITGVCLFSSELVISQDVAIQPERSIAGIPLEEAIKIHERYAGMLRELPGVVSVALSKDGLVVETVNPSALPSTVEALPVIPIPPIDPWAGRTIDGSTPVPLREPTEPPPLPTPPVTNEPKESECSPGAFRRPGEEQCRFLKPPSEPPIVELLPPPPGVIVLRPGKVREQADACPQGFKEVEGDNNWRFCVDPKNPETIPPLWSPPIANIPFETALEIHQRHIEDFVKLPGTHSVGLGADGIHVYTSNSDVVPKEVEGLPVKVFLWEGGGVKPLSHTLSSTLRPLHGAAFIDDSTLDGGGTLTGIALSQGKPWLIFPSHLLNNCNQPPPCALDTAPLNQCPHYISGNQLRILQPPSTSLPIVGYAQRWTQLIGTGTTADVAAAFMDSDLVDGNGSLSADRRVENATSNSVPFLGTTISVFPTPGSQVRMRPSIGPPHELTLRVEQVNLTILGVGFCAGAFVNVSNQIWYTMLGGYTFEPGDSGSPVFDSAERLVGMINICELDNTRTFCIPTGYGTDAFAIKNVLRFDA
jgi:hypothetical protein